MSVVLTALAISIVTSVVGSRDAHNRVVGQLKSVATLKMQEILTWTDGLRLSLDIVLSFTEIPRDLRALTLGVPEESRRGGTYNQVQERFLWAVIRMGLFEEVFFMDKDGVVLISTDQSHEGQRVGLNDYFVQGLKGKYLQEPSYSLSLGKMTIVASAPVLEGGETIGVIAGRADLSGLNAIMIERAGLGETGETYLVGSNYRLLTYLRQPGYSIPDTYIRTEGTDAAIGRGRDGSATYRGYAGDSVIGVYDWIPGLKVALIAEQEQAEALGPTRIALTITSGVAILAAILAILAGIALTRRIVRPLAQLGNTAGRIAAGELDLEADVGQHDEIGTLAGAFNRMTARLRDLVRNLERRTDHLRAINEAGRHISAILDLKQLVPYVARSLVSTFDYQSVRVLLLTGNTGDLRGDLLTCEEDAECGEPTAVDLREPVCLPAISAVASTGEHSLLGVPGETGRYAEIAVPIRIKDSLVGVLDITARSAQPLDGHDVSAAQTLADQLAIAIENSRLYEQADESAAGRERQRLARDLHDAVSQTLFSVSLIAEVLPRIYERNPDDGRRRLEELRVLTRGALAEMRTLLLELRPAALADAQLPDLLRQLGEAAVGRARIPVEVETDEGCSAIPPEARVALYYIAQEALNNVAKHSGASKARVQLTCSDTGVHLSIEDDGRGFDPASSGAGQLGLGIMRERAESFGGTLTVQSAPAQGTKVMVTWSPTTDRG